MSEPDFTNIQEVSAVDVGKLEFVEPSIAQSLEERQRRHGKKSLWRFIWTFTWPKYVAEFVPRVEGLIGDRSGRRMWAAEADFLLAVVASMSLVVILPDYDPLLKGLTFYLLYLLYFQLTEYLFGTTPAKWWFGLCVRAVDGRRASFTQITIRTLFRVLELNPILMGAFPAAIFILLTPRHVRLGDMVAGTLVLRVEDL